MLGETPALANCLLGAAMSSSSSSLDYAGDIGAAEAWDMLKGDPKAQLVDVRTMAEWNFVGLPDLASLGRKVHCIEWQSFPYHGAQSRFRGANLAARWPAPAPAQRRRCCFSAARGRARAPPPWR